MPDSPASQRCHPVPRDPVSILTTLRSRLPSLLLGPLGLLSHRREQRAVRLLTASEERLQAAHAALESEFAERTRELAGSEQQLRLLLDSTVEAIFGIGLDGRCTFCNPAAVRMLGWSSENDLLGRELHALTHFRKADGSPYPVEDCPINRALHGGGRVAADDEVFFRADGSSFPVRYSAHPMMRGGTLSGAVLTFFDLSESRRTEGELRTLIQTSIDGYWVSDSSGAFLDANSALCGMLGYSREELLGMHVADIEADPTAGGGAHLPGLVQNGSNHVQTRHRRKDGRLIDVEISSRHVPALGQRFFAFVRDISGQKLAESQLRQVQDTQLFLSRCGYLHPDEKFFAQLARYLAEVLGMDYVCIDSLEGDGLYARTEAIYFDGAFEDNLSYELKDTPSGVVVGQQVCCFQKGVRHLFPNDRVLQEMLAESYVGCTLWGFDGTPIGLIAIIGRQPLSSPQLSESLLKLVSTRAAGELERQRAEQLLRTQQLQLEDLVQQRTAELSDALAAARLADRAKDQFLANVSHELRTPLNAVIGLSALARRLSTSPLQQDYLDKVGNAGKSLAHLINDLLDLTKIVAGRLQFENTSFSLRGMFERSNSVIMHQALEKGLEIHQCVDDDIPDLLIGDPLRLEQILLNLLGNAIKFTSAGRIDVRIRQVERDEERVCLALEVEDSGVGLREEEIAQLFKPFSQADATMTRKYGGTGLGLAICKRLAEMMDGEISVRSRPGNGSTFRVTLWLALGKAAPADGAGRPGTAALPLRYRQARVLVVEDQPLNREIVGALLGEVGIVPVLAGNGDEALEMLYEVGPDAFDLVLMDIQMPVMDGLSATRELRSRAGFEALPIIAMTAHTMAHEKAICTDAGMNDFIGKPFDTALFFRTLAKWMPLDKHRGDASLASTPEPPATDWSALSTIDSAAGLARFAGDEARYRYWLSEFAEQGPAIVSGIRRAVAAGESGQAQQLAHALAGRIGMLGMADAHALAKGVEAATERSEGSSEWIDGLELAVCAASGQIDAALATDRTRPPAAPPPPSLAAEVEGPQPARISALLRLLETSDGDSAQAIENILPELQGTPWSPRLHSALERVRSFDFDGARRLFADDQTTGKAGSRS
jgi:PAS domain S-box-containing protein